MVGSSGLLRALCPWMGLSTAVSPVNTSVKSASNYLPCRGLLRLNGLSLHNGRITQLMEPQLLLRLPGLESKFPWESLFFVQFFALQVVDNERLPLGLFSVTQIHIAKVLRKVSYYSDGGLTRVETQQCSNVTLLLSTASWQPGVRILQS